MICFNNNLHISNSKKIMEIVMIIALLFANIYIYIESFNLCRHLLIIDLLLSDQRHQSISSVSGD